MKGGLTFLLMASVCMALPAFAATYENVDVSEDETLTIENGQTANNTTALYKATVVVKDGGRSDETYVGYTSKDINGYESEDPDESYGPITVGSSVINVEEGGVASNTVVGNSSQMNVSGNANVVNLQWSNGSQVSAAGAPKLNISGNGTASNVTASGAYSSIVMSDNARANDVAINGVYSSIAMTDSAFASNVVLSASNTLMTMGTGTSAENISLKNYLAKLTV